MPDKSTLDEMLAEKFPLDAVGSLSSVDVKAIAEDPAVRDSRLRREEGDAFIERIKDLVRFVVVILFILALAGFCIYMLVDAGFSEDDKKWAQTILSAILAGFLGYVFGRSRCK